MSSAITTYTGTLTAQERADLRWGMTTLTPREQARHDRLIAAIRRMATHAPEPMPTRPAPRFIETPTYWRDRRDATVCERCNGTGEIPCVGFDGEYEGMEACWMCRPLPDLPYDDGELF